MNDLVQINFNDTILQLILADVWPIINKYYLDYPLFTIKSSQESDTDYRIVTLHDLDNEIFTTKLCDFYNKNNGFIVMDDNNNIGEYLLIEKKHFLCYMVPGYMVPGYIFGEIPLTFVTKPLMLSTTPEKWKLAYFDCKVIKKIHAVDANTISHFNNLGGYFLFVKNNIFNNFC